MKQSYRVGVLVLLGVFIAGATRGVAAPDVTELEETYELRLEKVLHEKGTAAMLEVLQHDMAANPRPYVKAWYANRIIWKKQLRLDLPETVERGYQLACESAAEGSLTGLELQGRCLVYGEGGQERQPKVGAELLLRAAEKGRYTAMVEIARLYVSGYGIPRSLAKADFWARRAAYHGTSEGLYYLGTVWQDGTANNGLPDLGKAAEYYFDAAWSGNGAAAGHFNALLKQEDTTAEMLTHLATVEHVNMSADLLVGSVDGELLPSRIRREVAWLEKNAPANTRARLAVAQLRLKVMQPVYDPAKARRTLEILAKENNDDARYWLAYARFEGIGEKANRLAALETWRELAARRHPLAMYKLGTLYYWGYDPKLGFAKDPDRAFEYVKAAAENGCWLALFDLAACYQSGIGTEVNYYRAAKCWSILEDLRVPQATRQKNAILALLKD
jgi:TPR repeat protein